MEFVILNEDNLETEHICCAMADKKSANGAGLKKAWLRNRFQDGLVFKKAKVKGKVFIEYLPAENAWCPVEAAGYMFINCLWVAGSYKGRGYGTRLLGDCLEQSAVGNGVVVVSSPKKKPFLADKAFFTELGFTVADTAPPYFELLVKRFRQDAPPPKFRDGAKLARIDGQRGLTVLYTDQCPFTDYYVSAELDAIEKEFNIPVQRVKLGSKEQAQNAPSVFTTYSAFYNGAFLTHEILTRNKFGKLFAVLEK